MKYLILVPLMVAFLSGPAEATPPAAANLVKIRWSQRTRDVKAIRAELVKRTGHKAWTIRPQGKYDPKKGTRGYRAIPRKSRYTSFNVVMFARDFSVFELSPKARWPRDEARELRKVIRRASPEALRLLGIDLK